MKTSLAQKEIDILTLLDDTCSEDVLNHVNHFVKCTEKELNDAIKKFLSEELIEIIKLPNGKGKEVDWYFLTGKFERNLLNDNIRYERDRGPIMDMNYANKKIKEFQKDKTKKSEEVIFPK